MKGLKFSEQNAEELYCMVNDPETGSVRVHDNETGETCEMDAFNLKCWLDDCRENGWDGCKDLTISI